LRLPLFWVDAFAERQFCGNPAAVCVMEEWLPDQGLQAIATQNNLSETAFVSPRAAGWSIRWFTPVSEVDLCGHATLASAAVIRRHFESQVAAVDFESRSGPLRAVFEGDLVVLDFPSRPPGAVDTDGAIARALGVEPLSEWLADYYLAELDSEQSLRTLGPDMDRVMDLGHTGVIVTARGRDCDFVSRFFAPEVGVPEDPATGSAHCTLTPFWAKRLGKTELVARQLSRRGGEFVCRDRGDRVGIGGRAVHYLQGTIELQSISR
jgi:PhzF family phenazine biosynthesis protein